MLLVHVNTGVDTARRGQASVWIRLRDAVQRHDVAVAVAVAFAAGFVAFGRLPADVRNVLWAEDGRTFLEDRLRLGPWRSIVEVYEGYVHVVPRLLTDLAVWAVPLDRFAVASAFLATATFGVIAGLVYVCSRDLVVNPAFRVLLAMITVLAPVLPIEVLGNLANVHWGFLWLAPWLLLYRPRTWIGASMLGLVGLVGGLTEIQMLLLVPLALVNIRWKKAWLVAAPTLLGVAIQVLATAMSPRTPNTEIRPGLLDIVVGYIELPVLGAFEGHSIRIQNSIIDGGAVVAVLNTLIAAVVVGFALSTTTGASGVKRSVPAFFVVASLLTWAAAIWLNPGQAWQYADLDAKTLEGFRITRYVAVPSMLLLAGVVISAARAFDRGGRARFVSGLAVGIVLMGFVGSYHLEGIRRDGGPQWSTSIEQVRITCDEGLVPAPVEIAPASWSVDIACSDVEQVR